MQPYPILEFDPHPDASLNPHRPKMAGTETNKAVACFFQDVLAGMVAEGRLHQVDTLESEIGPNPLYTLDWEGQQFLVFHPGVGAPLAAGFVEEVIVRGVKKFIACGGCGVLQTDIVAGHPVVLTGAVRDEGTSYHYLPPGREVSPGPLATAALETALQRRGIQYLRGKSWTTDALYRETHAKRSQRIAEGCQVVEMEAAAFFAVAQFRGVEFGQVVYGGDLVVPEGWNKRDWINRKDARSLLFWLAVEACALL
jgi:uridine phosphorylase